MTTSLYHLLERRREGRRLPGHSREFRLVDRLQTAPDVSPRLPTSSTALTFAETGQHLLIGDEASRLTLYEPDSGRVSKSFDSGHTGTVLCTRFLAGCGSSRVVTCATDRQVRVIDLNRQAARPFPFHKGRVKTLAALGPDTFLSASEDGSVRLYDIRQSGAAAGGEANTLLVEQCCERAGRSSLRISIDALAVSPMAPHLFATGGGDPIARLYDMRMLPGGGGISGSYGGPFRLGPAGVSPATPPGSSRPAWVSAFAPPHVCVPMFMAGAGGGFSTLGRVRHLTALAFAASGRELLLSYSGDAIYAMDIKANAMSYDQLEARLRTHLPPPAPASARGGGSGVGGAVAGAGASPRPAAWEYFTPPRRLTPGFAEPGTGVDGTAGGGLSGTRGSRRAGVTGAAATSPVGTTSAQRHRSRATAQTDTTRAASPARAGDRTAAGGASTSASESSSSSTDSDSELGERQRPGRGQQRRQRQPQQLQSQRRSRPTPSRPMLTPGTGGRPPVARTRRTGLAATGEAGAAGAVDGTEAAEVAALPDDPAATAAAGQRPGGAVEHTLLSMDLQDATMTIAAGEATNAAEAGNTAVASAVDPALGASPSRPGRRVAYYRYTLSPAGTRPQQPLGHAAGDGTSAVPLPAFLSPPRGMGNASSTAPVAAADIRQPGLEPTTDTEMTEAVAGEAATAAASGGAATGSGARAAAAHIAAEAPPLPLWPHDRAELLRRLERVSELTQQALAQRQRLVEAGRAVQQERAAQPGAGSSTSLPSGSVPGGQPHQPLQAEGRAPSPGPRLRRDGAGGRVASAGGALDGAGTGAAGGEYSSSSSSSDEDAGFDDTPTMRREWRRQRGRRHRQRELDSSPQGLRDTGTLPLGGSQQEHWDQPHPQSQSQSLQRRRRRTRESLSSPASVSDMQYGGLPLSRQDLMTAGAAAGGTAGNATALPCGGAPADAAAQLDAAGGSGRAMSAGGGGCPRPTACGRASEASSKQAGALTGAPDVGASVAGGGDAMETDGEAGGKGGAASGSGGAPGEGPGAGAEAPHGTPQRHSKRARTHPNEQEQQQGPAGPQQQPQGPAAAAGLSAAATALGTARGLASRIAASAASRRGSAAAAVTAPLPAAAPSAAAPSAAAPAAATGPGLSGHPDSAPMGALPLTAAARAAISPASPPSQRTAAGSPASTGASPSQQPRRALLFRTRIGGPGSFGGAAAPAVAAAPAPGVASPVASGTASPRAGAGGSAAQDLRPGRAGSLGGAGLLLGAEAAAADRPPSVDAARGVGEVGLDPATVPLPWRRFSPSSRAGQQPQAQQQSPAAPVAPVEAHGAPQADAPRHTAAGPAAPGRVQRVLWAPADPLAGDPGPSAAGDMAGGASAVAAGAAVPHSNAQERRVGAVVTADAAQSSRSAAAAEVAQAAEQAGGGGSAEGGGGFLRRFDGHKNIMTVKEVAWIGDGGCGPSYVASGSDEGHVFVWDYDTTQVVRLLPVQDRLVPTCLAVHSLDPMIATCGNGTVVRLWAPGAADADAEDEEEEATRGEEPVDALLRAVDDVMEALDGVAAATAAMSAAAAALGGAQGQGDADAGTDRDDHEGGDGVGAAGRPRRSRLTAAQRQLVAANREDLARRQAAAEAAAAEAAARGRSPAGAGWATFAAAIRDRSADMVANATASVTAAAVAAASGAAAVAGVLAPAGPGAGAAAVTGGGATAAAGADVRQRLVAVAGTSGSAAAAVAAIDGPRAGGGAGAAAGGGGEVEGAAVGQSPARPQVLRLETALDRQMRRSGSPEETIPAFGPTPPRRGFASATAAAADGDAAAGRSGGEGAAGADDSSSSGDEQEQLGEVVLSPRTCVVM